MTYYTRNLERVEFVVTYACTGRCKHCSEGNHERVGEYIDGDIAAKIIHQLADNYDIKSVMTFGGEPLLRLDEVCKIHVAAYKKNIPNRQLITNGYFTKDLEKIELAARRLTDSGVNDLLLSVDAFHQEHIPLSPVLRFAQALKSAGVPIQTHPAWLVDKDAENPYNIETKKILKEFESIGISQSEGNMIFPSGNALIHLGEYFDFTKNQESPYKEDPEDIHSICISSNGNVLDGNIYNKNIMDIIKEYNPKK